MLAAVFDIPPAPSPSLSTRVKMGQSCNVYALVKADGKYLRGQQGNQGHARRLRRLTWQIRCRIRANVVGDSTEVKVLMNHEMETGQRKDAQGKVIPAWFIQNVTATWNGKTVLAAQWGPAVAKNPFLSFKFKGGAKGDKVVITWIDNRGDKRTDEATIA